MPLLGTTVLLIAIGLLSGMLAIRLIVWHLPSIHPGQQGLQQRSQRAHMLQLLLIQLDCRHAAIQHLPHHAGHCHHARQISTIRPSDFIDLLFALDRPVTCRYAFPGHYNGHGAPSRVWKKSRIGLTMTCSLELCSGLLRQLVEHLFPLALPKGHLLPRMPARPIPCSAHDSRLYNQP